MQKVQNENDGGKVLVEAASFLGGRGQQPACRGHVRQWPASRGKDGFISFRYRCPAV